MKNAMNYLLLIVVLCISSCSNTFEKKDFKIYTGDFANDPIELGLKMLDDSTVSGFSEHKGVKLNVIGKRYPSDKGYIYKLNEVGTNDFLGTYDCELDTSMNVLFGSWQQKKKENSTERMAVIFSLTAK
jgi:hypothetical protein